MSSNIGPEKVVTGEDTQTNVADLRNLVLEFVAERDWRQFHSPKNLSMSLAIEVSELMEHFQWLTTEQSREIDDSVKHDVGEELADCFCYLLAISNELGIDISSTLRAKMVKNREKYPVEEFKGRFGDNDSNPVSQ